MDVILIQKLKVEYFKHYLPNYLKTLPKKIQRKLLGRLLAVQDNFIKASEAGYIYKITDSKKLFSIYLRFHNRQERVLNFFVDKNTLILLNGFSKTSQQKQNRGIRKGIHLIKMAKKSYITYKKEHNHYGKEFHKFGDLY